MSQIIAVCDYCFDCRLDEETLDLIFEKAGVPGPQRTLRTAQSFMERTRDRMSFSMFSLERVFPESDDRFDPTSTNG